MKNDEGKARVNPRHRDKELCLALMRADTEEGVITLLAEAGYWDNDSVWRCYGDIEKNYSEIGNQASRPEATLVEKLINSVDARLTGECLARGIDPEGSTAPQSMRQGVAMFFEEGMDPSSDRAGRIRNWPSAKRTHIAKGITLAATGATAQEGNPCFTIADSGEGQTPEMVPVTLLSLPAVTNSNKMRIPFVQGKFNMGGTGVLRFCGYHNLQLIVTRRNPAILARETGRPAAGEWSFTVVRRESPRDGCRSSVYKYLAPVGAESRSGRGDVLHFAADTMPIFPKGKDAYALDARWGTLVKLYEYKATGCRTHMFRKDGLLSRLDLLLPDVALPIRLYECRDYKGHGGSFETNLTGLSVRLDDDRAQNLELGFPSSCPMRAAGQEMTAAVYAFKKGKADTYRKNEGIIFTLNGQTHGHLTRDFFRRTSVGLSYLSDSLLVIVDCTRFSARVREDVFMNSRDRLSGGDLRVEIETALEELLRSHKGLGALAMQRRQEEIASKLDDAGPLEKALESLLKRSPTLSALFLRGRRLSTPFKARRVAAQEGPFEGKRYPTYFKFKDREYGTELRRDCHINMRCRIGFETDAADDYFSRDVDQGEFFLALQPAGQRTCPVSYTMNLQNGIASLSVQLPADCREGDELRFVSTVADPTQVQPFENRFVVSVKSAVDSIRGTAGRHKPPSARSGRDREAPCGIALPQITQVYERDWDNHSPPFDQYTALRIRNAPSSDAEGDNANGPPLYDFLVNMDNIYLNTELKCGGQDAEITKSQFTHGMVLLGLALLHHRMQAGNGSSADQGTQLGAGDQEGNIEDLVSGVSQAIAAVLIPMLDSLGGLALESIIANGAGEAT